MRDVRSDCSVRGCHNKVWDVDLCRQHLLKRGLIAPNPDPWADLRIDHNTPNAVADPAAGQTES